MGVIERFLAQMFPMVCRFENYPTALEIMTGSVIISSIIHDNYKNWTSRDTGLIFGRNIPWHRVMTIIHHFYEFYNHLINYSWKMTMEMPKYWITSEIHGQFTSKSVELLIRTWEAQIFMILCIVMHKSLIIHEKWQ